MYEEKLKEENIFQEYKLFFENFDVVNEYEKVVETGKVIDCNVSEKCLDLMNNYITNECNFEKIKNIEFDTVSKSGRVYVKTDAIFHTVFSILLLWSTESLIRLKKKYNHLESFIDLFEENANYIFRYEEKYFIRNGLQIFTKWYQTPTQINNNYFKLSLNYDFFYKFENLLFTNQLTNIDALNLESLRQPFLKYKVQKSNVKYFTGTACSGKSTFCIPLKEDGWIIKSRGDLGSFSAKAHCAATICSLYQAENYALSGKKVIGDRGLIDNFIWRFIMHVMDPKKEDIVDQFIAFLEGVLNECSIKQFMSENVIIFLDLKPEENRKRMSMRAEGGDIQRCRIFKYPYVQTLCYGMVAMMFGWKIFTVPYDENNNVNFKKYEEVIKYINNFFPKDGFEFEDSNFSKPSNNFLIDHNYSKSVGIYK